MELISTASARHQIFCLLAACCVLFLSCALPVSAQTDIVLSSAAELASQRAEVEKRLSAAAAELKSAQEEFQQHPGVTEAQRKTMSDRALGWQFFVDLYHNQFDEIGKIQEQQISLDAVEQALADWQPPAGEPPWPLSQGDAVTMALYQAQSDFAKLNERIKLINDQIVAYREERDEKQVKYHLQQEKALIPGQDADAALQPTLELARMELDYYKELIYLGGLKQQSVRQESRLKALEIQRLQKMLSYFNGRYVLGVEELAKLNEEIDQNIERLRELERQGTEDMAAAQKQIDALRQSMAAPFGLSADEAVTPAEVRRKLEILTADQERLQSRLERYRMQFDILNGHKNLWSLRAALYSETKPDHAEMLKLDEEFTKIEQRVDRGRRMFNQVIESNSEKVAELRKQLALNPPEDERLLLIARLESAISQVEDGREALEDLKQISTTIRIVTREIDRMYRSGSVLMWLRNAWVAAGVWANAIWNFELMAIDDTVTVEGREIRATRSVTIGKSIGAVIILIVGYLLMSWTIRLLLSLSVARLGVSAETASLIGRWLRLIAVATLIVLSVHLVQIPLKIFAFLGGALAIGVGFGAQTLLKNLISGVMLLAERPVRVGDLVEVANIRGRITSIGIRFSTIYTSQGMDMLIPNSMLVEEKLINWTYSNQDVRYELRIGIAYESDVKKVTQILLDAAQKHPAVIDHPTPIVTFEDFGDNALMFVLRFWLRMSPGVDEKGVMSDLRYAILDALTKAGVVIPFRDPSVHLLTDAPIEIRVQT